MLIRTAVATPRVHLGDPRRNAEEIIELARRASELGAAVTVFPELSVTGYSLEDLLQQQRLLVRAREALERIAAVTSELAGLVLVGLPLAVEGRLFNCAVAISAGRPVAVVPKTYLPNSREFYEKRHFASGAAPTPGTIELSGVTVPFGTDLLLVAEDVADLVVHIEICEDLWTPAPPSSFGALAGATVLANLSASNATLGKADVRKALASVQSLRCVAAHVYSAAGSGESTTDLAWDGQGLVHELGELVAEGERFSTDSQLLLADIDLERIVQERLRATSFHDARARHDMPSRQVRFNAGQPAAAPPLRRPNPRRPYVPTDRDARDARCYEAFSIQCQGLEQRLRASGIDTVVLGLSGGLDSTHALLVAVAAMKALDLPNTNIHAYSLPGFATSERTHGNARALADALGVSWREIDIRPQASRMLEDIGHPAAQGAEVHDVTYENVQAGARTSILFRVANNIGGLVLGTGDLTELALGWCTYGVGDQMSHYNVNASIPKSLIRHLIRWVSETGLHGPAVGPILDDILATPISPELVPTTDGSAIQSTESAVGPLDLHDFFLFHTLRFGLSPEKILVLALDAWASDPDGDNGDVDDGVRYAEPEIRHWLGVFLQRFFGTSQFKRSAAPNGPKVTPGGSLSPRGDWRAPSDSSAVIWRD